MKRADDHHADSDAAPDPEARRSTVLGERVKAYRTARRLTLRQLGEHAKPIVAVSDGGYFDALAASLRSFVGHGLASARDVDALELVPSVEAAIGRLGLQRATA